MVYILFCEEKIPKSSKKSQEKNKTIKNSKDQNDITITGFISLKEMI